MAVETISPTIFSGGSIFTSLGAGQYRESGLDALSRSLRAVIDPLPQTDLLKNKLDRYGFSADTPSLFYHPNRLSLSNTILLSSKITGPLDVLDGVDLNANSAIFQLQEFALIDRLPFLSNPAARILNEAVFGPDVIMDVSDEAASAMAAATTAPTVKLTDYTSRPSEYEAFGSTYGGVANDSSLNADFYSRVSLAAGNSVSLNDLLRAASTGSPTHYAISLQSDTGGAGIGEIQDQFGNPVADNTVIAAADLANYTYVSPTNPGGDFLSFIELSDPGGDGTYDGRGSYQVVGLGTGEAEGRRVDGSGSATDAVIDYTFYTESGTATKELDLVFSGVSSLGYTNALDAINGGALRVLVSEELPDGTFNKAVVDLYVSGNNTITAKFPFPAADGLATNGLSVEIRALDSGFDLSTVEVRAVFG